jgi:ABC-type polysaccharide/polyol phosphate transport system ATPase subunit
VRELHIGCEAFMSSIILDSVSVDFPIYNLSTRSLKKNLIRLTTGGKLSSNSQCIVVRALDDISLKFEEGDRVGLVGHNGAGKSTLLRVLSNIYEPTQGTIHYDGKISSLLNVMLGINPESTGYENIYLRGLLLGLSRKEIDTKVKEIAEFTELGDFLYVPIRTYSQGMQMRLAFAVATCIQPEILLMDEVIGVGDKDFIERAQDRLSQLIKKSSIVLLASHAPEILKKICNKILIMDAGKVQWFGRIDDVIDQDNFVKNSGWI